MGHFLLPINCRMSFKKLPMNDNWKDVLISIPPQKLKAEDMPVIFVTEEPAELIQLKGEPDYKPIPQTSLTWVSNTDSDLDLQSCG